MRKLWLMLLMLAIGVGLGLVISSKLASVEARSKPGAGFAAVPGTLGSEDLTGPYELVKNWPQDVSTLPGMKSGRMARVKASSRRARIASICCSAASSRRWPRRKPPCSHNSGPASAFRLPDFGVTPP